MGFPLIAVDIAQTLLNTVLLAGVIRIAQGTPARSVTLQLLSSSGPMVAGYGLLAFLLVVLWLPVGLGPFSVLLILAPMLGAWWAYRQYGEERDARERTLGVLVSAIETKAPHLEGHSARVAELSRAMAEDLGLGPGDVRDIRMAGMLHDLGQVALPRRVVLEHRPRRPGVPQLRRRGAQMLRGVSFLSGALDGIAHHAESGAQPLKDGPGRWTPAVIAPHIVHVVDAFDLLTTFGDQDNGPLPPDAAIADSVASFRLRTPASSTSSCGRSPVGPRRPRSDGPRDAPRHVGAGRGRARRGRHPHLRHHVRWAGPGAHRGQARACRGIPRQPRAGELGPGSSSERAGHGAGGDGGRHGSRLHVAAQG